LSQRCQGFFGGLPLLRDAGFNGGIAPPECSQQALNRTLFVVKAALRRVVTEPFKEQLGSGQEYGMKVGKSSIWF